MKTATTIEQQDSRKDARDNDSQQDSSPELRPPVRPKSKQRDASRIAPCRFKPGQSGNPGGVPKHDVSKEIAQAIFINNPEMIYEAYCRMMRHGNAYCFQVIAERAWGKLRERVEIDRGPFADVPTEDLITRMRQLEEKLGYRKSEELSDPEVLPPVSDSSKPN